MRLHIQPPRLYARVHQGRYAVQVTTPRSTAVCRCSSRERTCFVTKPCVIVLHVHNAVRFVIMALILKYTHKTQHSKHTRQTRQTERESSRRSACMKSVRRENNIVRVNCTLYSVHLYVTLYNDKNFVWVCMCANEDALNKQKHSVTSPNKAAQL